MGTVEYGRASNCDMGEGWRTKDRRSAVELVLHLEGGGRHLGALVARTVQIAEQEGGSGRHRAPLRPKALRVLDAHRRSPASAMCDLLRSMLDLRALAMLHARPWRGQLHMPPLPLLV